MQRMGLIHEVNEMDLGKTVHDAVNQDIAQPGVTAPLPGKSELV